MYAITAAMGRLVKDVELRYTNSNKPVANFTIAVDRNFSPQGERKTDFFKCVAWNATAEFISKYFRKGSMVLVDGRPSIESWEDRQGNKRETFEIVVENAYFAEKKQDGTTEYTVPENYTTPAFNEMDAADGELPF